MCIKISKSQIYGETPFIYISAKHFCQSANYVSSIGIIIHTVVVHVYKYKNN